MLTLHVYTLHKLENPYFRIIAVFVGKLDIESNTKSLLVMLRIFTPKKKTKNYQSLYLIHSAKKKYN